MPDVPSPRVVTPLDRLVDSLRAWDKVAYTPRVRADRRGWDARDQVTLERAKGAVMLRYGVRSDVAFAILARWARASGTPITTLARTVVDGRAQDRTLPPDRPPLDDWLDR